MDLSFQETFDRVCREQIAPHAREADRQGSIAPEVWRAVVDSGYLRLFHPPELGGIGADGATHAHAMESLARACPGTYWSATASSLLCAKAIHGLGQPAHWEPFVQPLIRGERVGCFAVTERGPASDPTSYRTLLIRTPKGFLLRGEKLRVTNAPVADVAVVLGIVPPEGNNPPQTGFAFVDCRNAKVRRFSTDKLGLRAMPWGGLAFDDVEIDPRNVWIGDLRMLVQRLAWGQLMVSCSAIGSAAGALDAAVAFTSKRTAYGRPLAHLEAVHGKLAEMWADIDGARLLALDAACALAEGRPTVEPAWLAKLFASEMATRVGGTALALHGAAGLTDEHDVARHHRDILSALHGGMANDRIRELLASAILGVPLTYADFDAARLTGA